MDAVSNKNNFFVASFPGTGGRFFAAITIYLAISYLPFFFLSNEQMWPHVAENGFYQRLTSLAFLCASVLLAISYFAFKDGNNFRLFSTRKNLFVILLSLVLFVGAGEEESWGQHLFGFQPPAAIAEKNLQDEFNFHNMEIFHPRYADGTTKTGLAGLLTLGKLFSYFWFGFCVCIPVLALVSSRARRTLQTVNMPIVPLWIGIPFLINHAMSKFVEVASGSPMHYVVEAKEAEFAVLFFIFAIYYFFGQKRQHETAQIVSSTGG